MVRSAVVLELSGDEWEVREAIGDTWEWYLRSPVGARNNAADAAGAVRRAPGWLPARVPGSVIGDLERAGEIEDPRVGRNSRAAEWTGSRYWVYRRAVEVPAHDAGAEVVLELDGVDPGARVYWDGVLVGELTGLARPGRFLLPSEAGPHTLALVVAPIPKNEPQVGRTARVRRLAPRVGYGWDFCPPFPHQGIWRPLRLRIGTGLLGDVSVRSSLSDGVGMVHVDAGSNVRTEVLRDDAVVASGGTTVRVEDPELWWPAGLGAQALYDVVVRTPDGSDERRFRTGFRTVRFDRAPGAPEASLAYSATVNGVPVALIGWNWAPADAQFGEITAERLAHLIALTRESGAHLLRVWGGGLAETEDFYRACDEAGLLVWQEFSQSSSGAQSAPAQDEEFLRHVRDEARAVVRQRTAHPSLILWGGGNELDEDGIPLDEERSRALSVLRDAVRELDPERHWLPTSPSGPAFHHRLDVLRAAPDDQHDVHGPWEHQGLIGQYELGNAGTSLAHTEFGVEGMANARQLEELVPAGARWPADRTNPVYRHLGEWWNNADLVQELFGGRLTDVALLRRASQWLQATGLAYSVEADRRRAPRCSMVLPWQLAESYPNAWCTSVVDFLGETKPAFWSVTRAFAPVRATLRVDRAAWAGSAATAEAWAWSFDGSRSGELTLRARALDGTILAEERLRADRVEAPRASGTLTVEAEGLFLWEADWAGHDRELMVATGNADLTALLDLPAVPLGIERDGNEVRVTNDGDTAVLGLHLADARPSGQSGFVRVTGDPRPLLPGETRRFRVEAAPRVAWRYRIESWNSAPAEVGGAGSSTT